MICFINWHSFKKVDKNIHHDFLVCQDCGKRKFRFKNSWMHEYHWVKNNDFSKRSIIEAWINGASYEETRDKLFK